MMFSCCWLRAARFLCGKREAKEELFCQSRLNVIFGTENVTEKAISPNRSYNDIFMSFYLHSCRLHIYDFGKGKDTKRLVRGFGTPTCDPKRAVGKS